MPNRLEANPPDVLVNLSGKSTLAILAASGVPPDGMDAAQEASLAGLMEPDEDD